MNDEKINKILEFADSIEETVDTEIEDVDMFDMVLNGGKSDKWNECSHCHGYGSSLKESAPKCTVCGGSGLVKKSIK